MARFDLTDFELRVIRPLPLNKPRGVPRVDNRRVLNGIFWRLRTGAPLADTCANPKSPFEVELTINADREKPFDIGDGYGHLAVLVDDLDAEHARMKEEGLGPEDIKELDLDGTARFFFVTDPEGYKIEVLGRSGQFKHY